LYNDHKTCNKFAWSEVGAAATASVDRETLSQFQQLDYLANSIVASVAGAGGDEIR
jgi:hypothetical protein